MPPAAEERKVNGGLVADGERQDEAKYQPIATRINPKRHYKNLAVICTCFHLVNAAFLTLQALQGSFNATLGFVALAVLYVFFIVTTTMATFVIRMFGPKYVIVLCCIGQCLYMASNYYPQYYTLIPGSVIGGLSLGLLWISSAIYVTTIAVETAQALGKQGPKYISIFMGIFFMVYGASVPVGNAISSAVLLSDAGGLLGLMNEDGNVTNNTMCMSLTQSGAEVSPWAFYSLLSIFFLFDVAAVILSIFGLDQVSEKVQKRRTCSGTFVELKTSLTALFKTFFNPRFFFIGPMVSYLGFNIGTLAGVILKHFVTECVGVGVVGLTQIVWGLCLSVSSIVVGKVATKVPRTFLVAVGALGDAGVLFFLIFWERTPSYVPGFVISIVFGLGMGVWNTVPASFTGIVAKGSQKQTAFSVWQTWISSGFCASFVLSTFAPVEVNLWCLLGLLIIASPLYIVTDIACTSNTKDFFKSMLRTVCCYSGVYSTSSSECPAVENRAVADIDGSAENDGQLNLNVPIYSSPLW